MPNPKHLHISSEWGTPSRFVEASRMLMGSIDLDPASSEEHNKIVRATHFFSKEDNGLEQEWFGNVFINPPGGLVKQFWERLYTQRIAQAVWIGYSLEQLQTLQAIHLEHTPLEYPICVPFSRIPFIGDKRSPTHANYITYIGSKVKLFREIFGQFGDVKL